MVALRASTFILIVYCRLGGHRRSAMGAYNSRYSRSLSPPPFQCRSIFSSLSNTSTNSASLTFTPRSMESKTDSELRISGDNWSAVLVECRREHGSYGSEKYVVLSVHPLDVVPPAATTIPTPTLSVNRVLYFPAYCTWISGGVPPVILPTSAADLNPLFHPAHCQDPWILLYARSLLSNLTSLSACRAGYAVFSYWNLRLLAYGTLPFVSPSCADNEHDDLLNDDV